MLWHTAAKSWFLVALSVFVARISAATRTHPEPSQTQLEASRVDESLPFASKVVVYSSEQLHLAVQAGQRYIELREHVNVEHTIFTGQALFLQVCRLDYIFVRESPENLKPGGFQFLDTVQHSCVPSARDGTSHHVPWSNWHLCCREHAAIRNPLQILMSHFIPDSALSPRDLFPSQLLQLPLHQYGCQISSSTAESQQGRKPLQFQSRMACCTWKIVQFWRKIERAHRPSPCVSQRHL